MRRNFLKVLSAVFAVALLAAPPASTKPKPKPDEWFLTPPVHVEHRAVTAEEVAAETGDSIVTILGSAADAALAPDNHGGCWEVRYTMARDWWLLGYWLIWQQTYYCSNYAYITYRSTQQGDRSGGGCYGIREAYSWRDGGGVGHYNVDVGTSASFFCYAAYGSPYMVIRYTVGGAHWPIAWSGTGSP